ncbi:MAG TPA: SDR family oxidoreductase [Polyangiales bacterium]|nr:SDR family oxidoreductase [Polyangiales bacterium]
MPAAERVVVVTGGGRGIGRAIADRLSGNGERVVVFERDAAGCREVEQAGGARLHALQVDVGSEAEVAAGMQQVAERWQRLDALVNNAGIADPSGPGLRELSLERWRAVVDTNLTGVFLCTKHALALLERAPGAAVVNIASTRALQSEPHTEAYAASKGGMLALTHALALSLGPAVRVNAVSPGWIETRKPANELRPEDHRQHPVGRVGVPADVAAMVAFLLSDQAAFITGQNFVVDGGMTRKMIYAD